MLTDVLQSSVAVDLYLRDGARHARSELAQIKTLSHLIEAIHLLEELKSIRDHEQGMKQMTVMAEAITTAARRLRILPFDRQIEVVSDVFRDLVARAVGVDEPLVATDRQRVAKE